MAIDNQTEEILSDKSSEAEESDLVGSKLEEQKKEVLLELVDKLENISNIFDQISDSKEEDNPATMRVNALAMALKNNENARAPLSLTVLLTNAGHIDKWLRTGEYPKELEESVAPKGKPGRRPGTANKTKIAPIKKSSGRSKPGPKPGIKKKARR
jgi:hypothetical protein